MTDRPAEIIRQFVRVDDRVHLHVCDIDNEYTQTNYGIGRARGDILHSDDSYYTNDVLSHVAEVFAGDYSLDVLCTHVLIVADYGDRIEAERDTDRSTVRALSPLHPCRAC